MSTASAPLLDEGPRLRRNLNVWEAIGVSLALMAPSMAANINPQAAAMNAGRAVPLVFLIATVAVLLVAHTFVRLSQKFNHAGSVYGYLGATLGPRWGVTAGWALAGTYMFYAVLTAMAAGIFGSTFLSDVGIWKNPPTWSGFLIGGLALLLVWYLAVSPIRLTTNTLLVLEGTTVLLIIAIAAVVLFRLLNHSAPTGTSFTWSVFKPAGGISQSALFLGVVFGFLSFAGFEAASTLGEETNNPRRDIPRAILGVALFGGAYFVVVTAIEVMGFGTSAKGLAAFTSSGSLLGDLGSKFIASWVGDVVTLGTAISGFACALACTVGAARLLYALSRDGIGPRRLATVSKKRGTPSAAVVATVIAAYLTIAVTIVVFKAKPFDTYSWTATIGTLVLLVVYFLTCAGAIRVLFFTKERTTAMWEIVLPIAAMIVLGYTLYRNVIPYPTGAGKWLPIIAAIWILFAVAVVVVRPKLAREAGVRLALEDGLMVTGGAALAGTAGDGALDPVKDSDVS